MASGFFVKDGKQVVDEDGNWTGNPINASLSDLTNVSSTLPSDGQVLKWDSSLGQWAPGIDLVGGGNGGATQLAELNDVSSISPLADQVLKYNASTNQWTPSAESGLTSLNDSQLSDLSDVSDSVAQDGQVLKWQSGQWQPANDSAILKSITEYTGTDSQKIQSAIDDVFAAGGGTVFIPEGVWNLTSQVVVKNGVTLVGSSYGYKQGATDSIQLFGTVLNIRWGSGAGAMNDYARAAFILNEGSRVRNLAVNYPDQVAPNTYTPIEYGPTFKLFENKLGFSLTTGSAEGSASVYHSDCEISDVIIRNGTVGVDLRGSSARRNAANTAYQVANMTAHRFDNIKMCTTNYGFRLDNITDWVFINRCHQQPGWISAGSVLPNQSLRSYVQENFVFFEFAGVVDWVKITDCVAWAIRAGAEFKGGALNSTIPFLANCSGPVTFIGCDFDGATNIVTVTGQCYQLNLKMIGCTFAPFNANKFYSDYDPVNTAVLDGFWPPQEVVFDDNIGFNPNTDSGFVVAIADNTIVEGITISNSFMFGWARGWLWAGYDNKTIKRLVLTGNATKIDASIVNVPAADYALNLGTAGSIEEVIVTDNIFKGCVGEYNPTSSLDRNDSRNIIGNNTFETFGTRINSRTIHVRDFGAIGDGVTDDTAAIQAALNYVNVLNGGGGGTVMITGGKYLVDSADIIVPDGVTLKGDFVQAGTFGSGRNGFVNAVNSDYTQLNHIALNTQYTLSMRSGSGVDGLVIIPKNTSFPMGYDQNDPNGTGGWRGTAITINADAINVDSLGDVTIRNSLIVGFEYGIVGVKSPRLKVQDCNMDCFHCIDVAQVYDIARFNNIHCWPFSTYFASTIRDFMYEPRGRGIYLHDVSDWSKITDCFTYGYLIGFYIKNANNVVITGCGADNRARSTAPFFIANSIGFLLEGECTDTIISNCQAAAQAHAGIKVATNGWNITKISGFSGWGIQEHGILIESGRFVISDTSYHRDVGNGITVVPAPSGYYDGIIHNTFIIRKASAASITLPPGSPVTVTNFKEVIDG